MTPTIRSLTSPELVALGDPTGEPAGGQADEQEKDKMDQAAHDDHRSSEESILTANHGDPDQKAPELLRACPHVRPRVPSERIGGRGKRRANLTRSFNLASSAMDSNWVAISSA